MSPFEVWSGYKPLVKLFKIFGSLCYYLVPNQKRSKIDDKVKKGIFLVYSSQSKDYRIFNLKTEKIIISRDVVCSV